jgi:hypothetical protein
VAPGRARLICLNTKWRGTKRRVASTVEEFAEDATSIGTERQRHTQRASGHHARRYRQGELLGDLRFAPLDQERNEGPQEEQKPG